MKIKVGKTANSFELFDDDGNKVEIYPEAVDIILRPNELTLVKMSFHADADLEFERAKLKVR